MSEQIHWQWISPEDAVGINLVERLDIAAPLTEDGRRCPWPWEPQQLVGLPIGMFHCSWCDTMCVAGMPHPDYARLDEGYEACLQRWVPYVDPDSPDDPFAGSFVPDQSSLWGPDDPRNHC